MKIENLDFGWPDPDLHSVEPVHTFPGEAQDEDMRRDTFPGFSSKMEWADALNNLKFLTRKRREHESL